MNNIVADLQQRAAKQPDALLYTFLDGAGRVLESYTYRQFHQRTNFAAAALLASGRVNSGDRVLLVYPPGLDFIVAFFACVKLGAVPVPVPPPDASGLAGGIERLAHVAADAGAAIALTNDSYLRQFQRLVARSPEAAMWLRVAPLDALQWISTTAFAGALDDFASRFSPLLFLQYTSGSTQSPRGVMVSHDNVWHNCWATLTHQPIGVSWLPHYHDMGLIGYYPFIMITGGSVYGFAGAHFLKRPLLWLETITRFKGTISSAPNFAFEFCLREDKVPAHKLAGLDLRSLCCMMNASEPVRASTYRRFLERFGPCGLSPKSSVVFYGLAENTLSATGNGRVELIVNTSLLEQNQLRIEPLRPDYHNQSALVSCGRPLAGVDVRIVNPQTSLGVGEHCIGEIWIGGESKTQGYWNHPVDNPGLFEARIDGQPDSAGYLRSGDVGFLHDGELFICGRLKDVVIIGGRNYYPTDIEAVVERAAATVRQGCVAAFGIRRQDGEGIAVIAEARRPNDLPDLEAICQAVRKHCHVDLDVLAIVPHGAVVKTSSGKIARQACRQQWESGALPILASRVRAERSGLEVPLQELLDRFDVDDSDERTLADLGVDSLTLVELSLHLERIWSTQQAQHRPLRDQPDDAIFDLRILQATTMGELRLFLEEYAAAGVVPELARDLYLARQNEIDRDEVRLMRQDARLPPDVQPRPARIASGARVLLTGATGFLGSFLLEALLRLTDYEIVTLVRAADAEHAATRVEAALRRTGLLDEPLRQSFRRRVRALNGDLSLPQLGLSHEQWQQLDDSVSGIYHCGAEVDYVKPYEQLRGVNGVATLALLRLASSARPKVFHFVSTTFMFGFVGREVCLETDANADMAGLNFGYSQTKWVAEQLVIDAVSRGLSARIYRPSLVSASREGRYVRGDLTARILSYMIQHRLSVDSVNQFSLLPVDVCANNIVALSCLPEPQPTTFHLTADDYYTMQAVCSAINARFGYPFEYVSLDQFIEHMNQHCTRHDLLFPLLAFFNQNHRRIEAMRDKRYDNRQYRQARQSVERAIPEPPLEETVARIVSFLQFESLVPAPPLGSVSAV
jgi:thioester reductase-like protein